MIAIMEYALLICMVFVSMYFLQFFKNQSVFDNAALHANCLILYMFVIY